MFLLWFHFLLSALFVVGAGMLIGRVSGEIGDRLGLGRAWAGAVLLSFATTLPELFSTITVTLRGETGMAVGGILGSVLFNLFIIVMVDVADPNPIYHRLSMNHVFTGLLGCVLLAVVSLGLLFGVLADGRFREIEHIGFIGVPSIVILLFYIAGQFVLLSIARSSHQETEMKITTAFDRLSFKKLLLLYGGLSIIIITAAVNLGISAEKLSFKYNLSATFAGATLLGIVTSLPEVTNALVSARHRDFDLAIGNIFGANAFVITVLAIADLLYVKESLFFAVKASDAISSVVMANLAIVMQGIALAALTSHSRHRVWRIGIASVLLAILYAISLYVSYRFTAAV